MSSDNKRFPCGKCCELDMSCCHNPQITWTMSEFDEVVTASPEVLKEVVLFKGELPGLIYVINKAQVLEADETNSVKIDYCHFYDTEKKCCSIYDLRPAVCSTYGDPKYNACPYDGMSEDALEELVRRDPEGASAMHKTAGSDPIAFGRDHVIPYVKAFKETVKEHPEYMEVWEKLPQSNFIRK